MICFSAFVPHTPLLIDSIGKNHLKQLKKTKDALVVLAEDLRASQPDVLFVISAHQIVHEKAFSVNLHTSYQIDFKEFGDHTSKRSFAPNILLASAIQHAAESAGLPFVLESSETLDYGSGVPLWLLTQGLHTTIVPISYSGLDRKQHLEFG